MTEEQKTLKKRKRLKNRDSVKAEKRKKTGNENCIQKRNVVLSKKRDDEKTKNNDVMLETANDNCVPERNDVPLEKQDDEEMKNNDVMLETAIDNCAPERNDVPLEKQDDEEMKNNDVMLETANDNCVPERNDVPLEKQDDEEMKNNNVTLETANDNCVPKRNDVHLKKQDHGEMKNNDVMLETANDNCIPERNDVPLEKQDDEEMKNDVMLETGYENYLQERNDVLHEKQDEEMENNEVILEEKDDEECFIEDSEIVDDSDNNPDYKIDEDEEAENNDVMSQEKVDEFFIWDSEIIDDSDDPDYKIDEDEAEINMLEEKDDEECFNEDSEIVEDSDNDPDYKIDEDEEAESSDSDAMSEVLELEHIWCEEKIEEAVNEVQDRNVKETPKDYVKTKQKSDLQKHASEELEFNLDELPKKRQLEDNDCLFDKKNPKIFIKKFRKENSKSKHNRVYDSVHACLFCHELFTNIQSHYERKHANQSSVKILKELKNQKVQAEDMEEVKKINEQLKTELTLLRNKGNNLHNRKVLKHNEGEIILPRRCAEKFVLEEYGPCPSCEEWLLLKTSITNHQKSCPKKNKDNFHKGQTLVQIGVLTGKISTSGSSIIKKEVLPSMKKDEMYDLIVQDPLILALGDIWLMKNVDNKRKRRYYSSFHMRLAARLLAAFRERKGNENTITKMLMPANFDIIAEIALEICSKNTDGIIAHPSTAVKSGFDIMRLASAKLGLSIKAGNDDDGKDATNFMQLMKMEWGTKVNKIARSILSERLFNKKKELPHPEDIVQFSTYLVEQLLSLDLNINLVNMEKFRRTVMLVQARLLLYNRRRPGELEALSLECYRNRSKTVSETDMALRQQLTELEKKMLETQELIEIRGKNGTKVPVICPKEVIPAMEFLANEKVRKIVGIKDENIYLFANSVLDTVRAADSLEGLRTECGLRFPSRIHATNLRKHCATIAQVIGLKDYELKWLCRHLGHTMQVHEEHYRSTSGLIERLDIAKLMLIQEGNMVGRFQGKSLKDINFEDILPDEADATEVTSVLPLDTALEEDVVDLMDDGNDILKTRKTSKKTTRKAWSKEEERELKKYFPEYFNGHPKRSCPTHEECHKAIKRSHEDGGVLHLRKWDTIKKKVYNSILKH